MLDVLNHLYKHAAQQRAALGKNPGTHKGVREGGGRAKWRRAGRGALVQRGMAVFINAYVDKYICACSRPPKTSTLVCVFSCFVCFLVVRV